MYTHKFNKKQKLALLILLSFGILSINLDFLAFNWLPSFHNIEESNAIYNDNQYLPPKTAEYQNFNGDGGNLNITLHQSYLNDSFNTLLNTSDSNNNEFVLPCPTDTTFNSSFTNITIGNVYAPNKSLTVEDDFYGSGSEFFLVADYFVSFETKGVGYIENITLRIKLDDIADESNLTIRLYDSELDGGRIRPRSNLGTIVSRSNVTSDSYYWHKIKNLHASFNSSNTYNNTFFLRIEKIGGSIWWDWASDAGGTDGVDEMETLNALENYVLFGPNTVDLTLKLDFSIKDNTPKPSEINLTINNNLVKDDGSNNGYWESFDESSSISGELQYLISANWWDVSCNITSVQINYTKTDVQSISSYRILGSGQNVQWNLTTTNGLNYFDSRLTDFNVINFTIPRIWNESSIKVFNGSTDKTSDIVKRLINNKYRVIQVLNAGNGTHWYLNATSSNKFSSIDTYVGGIARSMVNHSNTVKFNTTFSETIYDGTLNLSIFTPSQGNINHTKILDLTPLVPGNEFNVSDWDLWVDVKEYGIFKIQMSWNNDTAAGFLEEYITIIADTTLTPSAPQSIYDSGDTFIMTVIYEDTGQTLDIEADDIYYQIGSGPIRRDSIVYTGNGYNITFNCDDTDFIYGPNLITVDVEKTYYNNQTNIDTITILAETDAYIVYPAMNDVFNSGDNFFLELYYNDTVQNSGITGATIEYSLGGAPFRSDVIADYTNGYYNISISASDANFSGYGFKTVDVNINMDYHYNHSESVTIKLLGETTPITAVRIPDKVYYTAAETFNISLYYEDSIKSIGISGAIIEVDIGGTIHNPFSTFDYGDGNYQITIDCSDSDFDSYGYFPIRVNVSLTNYYNRTDTLNTLIVGNESLTVLAPNSGAVYIEGQSFDVQVEYIDTILGSGINGANIEYSLDGGSTFWDTPSKITSLGLGLYNITVEVSDGNFTEYGFVDVVIEASKQHYENRSTTYNFHRQITTQITPQNTADLGTVIKGLNVSYSFTYEDTNLNPIEIAFWTQISTPVGFNSYLETLGSGNYRMHLDTTNVLVTGVPYDFEFSIYAVGNETQTLTLTVDVLIIETNVVDVSYISEIARNSGLNQSVRFYFNDTTNNLPVLNVLTSNFVVKNYATGTPFNAGEFFLFNPSNNGTYILDITMGTRNSGWYTLEINASRFPNYGETLFNLTFYYRGNNTDINLITLFDTGGSLSPAGLYNFTMFEGDDLDIDFNITDSENFDSLIIGDADSYVVRYINLGTGANGLLTATLNFQTSLHTGTILTSNPSLTVGRYSINITTSRSNYEDASFVFNLTIIERYLVNLTVVYKPTEVNAGNDFDIIIKAEYYNGTDWNLLIGSDITITPFFNDIASPALSPVSTNNTGEAFFTQITINIDANRMNLTIQLQSEYYHQDYRIYVSDINVIPRDPGLTFEDLIPYIIMIGAVAVVVVAAVATYRGVIVPKKKEKQRVLTEVKTIFDDAINLEHILVLYKGTGTCIFFKSYGSEQIDPELIGGFLSAVSSFGKEMATQEALNEISYGDKMLLLADGNLIRVALVLGKNASLILRRHLKEFISTFEKTYNDVLPKWRGQLNYFKNAGLIVDDLLNTSIILPHQISYDFSSVKDLKNPHSKDVLKVAQSCCEETKREFFFIATLLKDSSEMTNKDTAEIFMGIKELRDKKILIPIEISSIEAYPISQQELNLINQKVVALPNLSNDEKQKLVQDLSQLGPVEREAYLTSLSKQNVIVTAPIKTTTVEGVDVDNKKSAKKGIKELLKRGKIAEGKEDHIRAIELYESAALLASNWELTDDYVKIEEIIRKSKIEDLKEKKSQLEKEAKGAVKAKKYAEAAAKFKYASKMASEIFKLGDTSMTKEVKRLTNKSNEYEKLK